VRESEVVGVGFSIEMCGWVGEMNRRKNRKWVVLIGSELHFYVSNNNNNMEPEVLGFLGRLD